MRRTERNRAVKKIFSLLLMTAVVLLYTAPMLATETSTGAGQQKETEKNKENSKTLIRVGYPIQKGLSEVDSEGKLTGYSYEYLMEIAKYANWEYEFVQAEGTEDEQVETLLEMLSKGEIDLLGGMVSNEATAELYDFPGYNYGTSYYTLCALDSNTRINSDSYYRMQGLRVAVISNHDQENEKLSQFARASGIYMEQVYCSSADEQMRMLETGNADVLLAKDISMPSKHLISVARFAPSSFYFATTKGNKRVVNKLNMSLSKIAKYNPYFSTNLEEKYFATDSDALTFTLEEKNYIKKTERLRAAVYGGKPALQYIDSETGEYKGVSVDVLNYISDITGIQIEIKMTEDLAEYEKWITSGEVDITVGVNDELLEYNWQKVTTTNSYLKAPLTLVTTDSTSPDEIAGKRLALPDGVSYAGEYEGEVVYFRTLDECLQAVHKGDADYCYSNVYSVQYYTNQPNVKNILSVPQDEDWAQEFCFGIVNEENEVLLGILNKSIRYFNTENLLQTYLYENAYQPKQVTLISYMLYNPFQAATTFAVVILVFVLFILVLGKHNDKKNIQIRKLENQRYEQISEISNEFLFEYDIASDCVKMSEKSAEFLHMPRKIPQASRAVEGNMQMLSLILQKENRKEELCMEFPNHITKWVCVITKCIQNSVGEPIYVVGKVTDINQEKEEQTKLMNRAQRDSLTGLYNMATFREIICKMTPEQKKKKYVFFVMDIDFFKKVNDTYGHYIGDCVLEGVGGSLKEVFRNKEDVIGRLGGDEFVALMAYHDDRREIESRCGFLKEKIGKINFPGKDMPITVSIGAALVDGKELDFDATYKQADKALYEVKKSGRNGFAIYQDMGMTL